MCKRVTVIEFEAVGRMLTAGMRHVEIARELDLSVDTVSRIAEDRRRGGEEFDEDGFDEGQFAEDEGPPGYVASNLRRCPGCGAMVYLWPCLACRLGTTARLVDEPEDDDEDEEDGADIFAELFG